MTNVNKDKVKVQTVDPNLTKVVTTALARPLRQHDPVRLALSDVLEYQPN
jgi:hypothetical protein